MPASVIVVGVNSEWRNWTGNEFKYWETTCCRCMKTCIQLWWWSIQVMYCN